METIREAFKNAVELVQNTGKRNGPMINGEDMASKLGISNGQMDAYLNDEADVPPELPNRLMAAYGIEKTMIRFVSGGKSGRSTTRRLSNREALANLVSFVIKTAATTGTVITTENIAKEAGISAEELQAYLDGTRKTPNKILNTVLTAYDHLIKSKATKKENGRMHLERSIVLIRNRGLADGMNINLKDMAEKMGITLAQMMTYLRDGFDMEEDFSLKLEAAYKDVIKNREETRIIEDIHVITAPYRHEQTI